MPVYSGEGFRESNPFWRDQDPDQNFGDFLTVYLLEKLFLHFARRPSDVRLVGSYLHDYHVRLARERHSTSEGTDNRALLVAWGGGVREPGTISPQELKRVNVLSVRGPLSARELALDAIVPMGDPGLLLPALYHPVPDKNLNGRTLCVPHFNDKRSDEEICRISGCDVVVRASIAATLESFEGLVDKIVSADFVLCGSLHAAIVAAAYGRPFGFWDSGDIDIPFKWQDFASSIGIDCQFFANVDLAKSHYAADVKGKVTLPAMWEMLAVSPYPVRPEALLSVLRQSLKNDQHGASGEVDRAIKAFSHSRQHSDRLVDENNALIDDLLVRISRGKDIVDLFQLRLEAERGSAEEALARVSQSEAELAALRVKLDDERIAADVALARLAKEGQRLAEELRRVHARPWRPVKRALQRLLLRLVLPFRGMLSPQRAEKFARSLNKRRPRAYTDGWKRTVARTRSERAIALVAQIVQSAPEQIWPPDPRKVGKVLVADHRIPRPDMSAGERATAGVLRDLAAIGFDVTFLPADLEDLPAYRSALEADGIRVITNGSGVGHPTEYLRRHASEFSLFYLFRIEVAEELLPIVREASAGARVIFHAPDLHFLRERRAEDIGRGRPDIQSEALRAREMKVMQAADLTVVVSPAEVPFVEEFLPPEKVAVFPALYSSVSAAPPGYAGRANIFFLGGFRHRPNVDAVQWFVDEVWPKVRAALPEAEFHILGADASPSVVDLGRRPGVRVVGHVPDLESAMTRYRLSVAPLRFGAGIKGKLGASLGSGIPTVCTTIAAEGMGIQNGVHALIRDDADSFAEAVVELYQSEELWKRLSADGHALVERAYGEDANRSGLLRVLDTAKALPFGRYIDYCKALEPSPLAAESREGGVLLSVIVVAGPDARATRSSLNSVRIALRGTQIDHEIVLVADEAEAEALGRQFDGLRVVGQPPSTSDVERLGIAAGMAKGSRMLFVAEGCILLPQSICELNAELDRETDVAIAVPATLGPDAVILEAGRAIANEGTPWLLGAGKPFIERLYEISREVDGLGGACVLVRRETVKNAGAPDFSYRTLEWAFSDLAMRVRQQGHRAVCVPAARAVAMERTATGARVEAVVADGERFCGQWGEILKRQHPTPDTPAEVAAALAERTVPALTAARRKNGALNILYFSPFPSHPDSHGNQATIQSFGRRFKALGHRVHFALLESGIYDQPAIEAMQAAWDSLDILPNTRRLWSDGSDIPFDDWYEPGLGENVRILCSRYDIDVVFCSYVFQSRLLDFVPAHVLKVIDTHDKMGDRYEMLRRNGQPLEFFSCTPEEEGRYLRRADVVVARRAEEAEYFDSVTGRKSAIVIPHVEEARFIDRIFGPIRDVGLVASANRINLAITLEFLQELAKRERDGALPFTLHIAGQVSRMMGSLAPEDAAYFSRSWVKLHGFVSDIGDFYRSIDLVVSPVTMGTGINVKTVQAMAYGMPLVTTRWGSKGIETGNLMHVHADLAHLVDGIYQLKDDPAAVAALAAVSRERYGRFLADGDRAIEELFRSARNYRMQPDREG